MAVGHGASIGSAAWNSQCEEGEERGYTLEILKGVGQTEGMVIPRCAASATWNPHVDVKGREDAAGTGPWQCRRGRSRGCRQEGKWETQGTEALWSLCGGLLGVAVGHGASIGCRQEMK